MQATKTITAFLLIAIAFTTATSTKCANELENAKNIMSFLQESAQVEAVYDSYLNLGLLSIVNEKIAKVCYFGSQDSEDDEDEDTESCSMAPITTCEGALVYIDNVVSQLEDGAQVGQLVQKLMGFSTAFRQMCLQDDDIYADLDTTLVEDLRHTVDDLVDNGDLIIDTEGLIETVEEEDSLSRLVRSAIQESSDYSSSSSDGVMVSRSMSDSSSKSSRERIEMHLGMRAEAFMSDSDA